MNKNFIERSSGYTRAEDYKKAGIYPYFRVIQSEQDTEVMISNRRVLMFGSNSYLGLTNHPKVKEASKRAISLYGTGCGGSRFLNGTLSIHVELEEALQEYLQREAVILYSTGFQANLGTLPPLVKRNDYVLIDERVHASIIDASRLTFGKVMRFKHNDVKDLESIVAQLPHECFKFIVVDGVFSMEGDIAPLPGIVKVAQRYNGVVVCDDAHAVGVIGHRGMGTGSHFGLNESVDIQIGTFSKSLASLGGFVASSKEVIEHLKHTSRSLIFSASMTPASVASVLAALQIIRSEPERIEQLWDNTSYALKQCRELGFDVGNTESPIIPLYIRDSQKTFILANQCFRDGVFINPIVSPGVPDHQSMIRISLMATHTHEQIDQLCEILYKNVIQMGILDGKEQVDDIKQYQG